MPATAAAPNTASPPRLTKAKKTKSKTHKRNHTKMYNRLFNHTRRNARTLKALKERRERRLEEKREVPRNVLERKIAEFTAKVKELQESNDPDSDDPVKVMKLLIKLRDKMDDVDVDVSDISAEIDIITGRAVATALTAIPKLVAAVKAKYPDEVKDELADLFAALSF